MIRDEDERAAAFNRFVGAHRQRAVSLAWRLCGGDRAAAEDVAQDAFLRAHRALPRFRADASLATWFYRILVRQAHNHRRWRRLARLFSDTPVEELPDPRGAAAPDVALQRRIAAALDRLSRGQREAFVLVHLEEFTVAEAAETLGKAPGTVKSHLHRALTALRVQLADLVEDK